MYIFGHSGTAYSDELIALNLGASSSLLVLVADGEDGTVTLQFEVKSTSGQAPAARGYATTSLYDNRIFALGGYDGQRVYDDLYTLELAACSYQQQSRVSVLASFLLN